MRKKSKFRFFLAIIAFVIAIITILAAFGYNQIYFPIIPGSSETKYFLVEDGQSMSDIAYNLEEENLIKSDLFFKIYVLLIKDVSRELKAGEYELSYGMTIVEIADKLAKGDVVERGITILEGWNLRDIAQVFEDKEIFNPDEFFVLVGYPGSDYSEIAGLPLPKDFSDQFDFLEEKPRDISLEGYFFPDTYEISKGESLEGSIIKILDNFDQKLTPEIREEIKDQGKTIFEIITMASILEKEVPTEKDKKIVAGILWKRIDTGMRLQIDATVNYATTKSDRAVAIKDTKIDSPYNTYQNYGLPLGPISNPGIESILAAMRPTKTSYWYYLSAKNGTTIFSRTFEEHKYNKGIYLK